MVATATTVPFSDASPAEIREVLLPEEQPQFEQDYAEALRQAREEYRLDKLEAWRRIAWMTASDPKAHRLMLQRAQYTLPTGGDILPGSRLVSQEEMEERLQARLAAG
jgi:Family of unknown function (DUF6247)